VLAPLLKADLLYIPHYFHRRALRPFDYALKLVITLHYIIRSRPSVLILQAPPLFAAAAALVTRTPYILDVHNAQVQAFWSKVPLTGFFVRHATSLIAHNHEIAAVLRERYPSATVFVIQDPLQPIGNAVAKRDGWNLLLICSFNRDEPTHIIPEFARALPEYTLTITANVRKLRPEVRRELLSCPNVRITGFLKTDAYHAVLRTCSAAVVLTTMPSVQPSGACEALCSDTPLIVSRSNLTSNLFGRWATLVDNDCSALVAAVRSLGHDALDLAHYRNEWNDTLRNSLEALENFLAGLLGDGASLRDSTLSPELPPARKSSSTLGIRTRSQAAIRPATENLVE